MSHIESYDGLCGIIHLYASSSKQVRCKYEFGHAGPHSWENKPVALSICGGTFVSGPPSFLSLPTGQRKKVVIGH